MKKTYEKTVPGCVELACDIERAKNNAKAAYEKYENCTGLTNPAWNEYQTCERERWALVSTFFGPTMADIWQNLVEPEVMAHLEKRLRTVAAADGIGRIQEAVWGEWGDDGRIWDDLLAAILRCAASLETEAADDEIPVL